MTSNLQIFLLPFVLIINRRALIFSFPYNVVRLFSRFMGAMIVSLAIGAVYWQVRAGREQEFVWDRVGFVTTMLSVGLLPVLLSDIWSGKSI